MNSPTDSLINLITKIGSNEVVLFAGTFDPWHKGHEACLKLTPKNKKIIIIPDRNPEKDIIKSDLSILKKLVNDNANWFLFEDFLLSSESNPTYFWYSELKEKIPKISINLLMGYDSFSSLGKWIQADKLLAVLDPILVAARMNQEQDFDSTLKELQAQSVKFQALFLGYHNFEQLSSTQIKKEL